MTSPFCFVYLRRVGACFDHRDGGTIFGLEESASRWTSVAYLLQSARVHLYLTFAFVLLLQTGGGVIFSTETTVLSLVYVWRWSLGVDRSDSNRS